LYDIAYQFGKQKKENYPKALSGSRASVLTLAHFGGGGSCHGSASALCIRQNRRLLRLPARP